MSDTPDNAPPSHTALHERCCDRWPHPLTEPHAPSGMGDTNSVTTPPLPLACHHGQLTRSCELCEKDAEIERLRAELDAVVADHNGIEEALIRTVVERDAATKRAEEAEARIEKLNDSTLRMFNSQREAEAQRDRIAKAVREYIEAVEHDMCDPRALLDVLEEK